MIPFATVPIRCQPQGVTHSHFSSTETVWKLWVIGWLLKRIPFEVLFDPNLGVLWIECSGRPHQPPSAIPANPP